MEEADPVGYKVALGVCGREGERVGRYVECGDLGMGKMNGQRDGDRSGTGAYVSDAEGFAVAVARGEFINDGFDQMLGEVARDEDGGGDAEGQSIELAFSGDVLNGLMGDAAVDGGGVSTLLLGCQLRS